MEPRLPFLVLAAAAALGFAVPFQDGSTDEPTGSADEAPASLVSIFVMPLDLGESRPLLRTVRNVRLVHSGAEGVSRDVTRSREETAALAERIVARLRAGADFAELARQHSADPNAAHGAVLGTFQLGVLEPPFDAFLWAAEVGDVSDVIEDGRGFHVLQRVETYAGARQILIRGSGPDEEALAKELLERLAAGEDFAALARAHSQDPASAERGGDLAVFERGPTDAALKAEAFAMQVGETRLVTTPLGLHVLQRVPLDDLDLALREDNFARLRALLVSHDQTPIGSVFAQRTPEEAHALAQDLHARIAAGEDMSALAREVNDDPTGVERGGDLGWVHRRNPNLAGFLTRAWQVEPGGLMDLIGSNAGWVIVRRER